MKSTTAEIQPDREEAMHTDSSQVSLMCARIRDLLLAYSIEVDEEMAVFIDQYVSALDSDAKLATVDRDDARLQVIVQDVHELLTSTEERIARAREDFDVFRS